MHQLTRTQYKKARRQIRSNGRYALRWMDTATRATMELVIDAGNEHDYLAERAEIIAYCKREGRPCNVRHTGRPG